jgi:hypothetical protein
MQAVSQAAAPQTQHTPVQIQPSIQYRLPLYLKLLLRSAQRSSLCRKCAALVANLCAC